MPRQRYASINIITDDVAGTSTFTLLEILFSTNAFVPELGHLSHLKTGHPESNA